MESMTADPARLETFWLAILLDHHARPESAQPAAAREV